MSYGLYDTERRYRRRTLWRIVKLLVAVTLIGGAALFAYQLGVEHARTAEVRQDRKIHELAETDNKLRQTVTRLEDELQQERSKARGLEEKLAREMPSEDAKALIEQLVERIKAGVDPKRLSEVISHAQNKRECQEPQSRRFSVQTPLQRGVASSVTFANETIAVTATGEATKGSAGLESWFDPAKAITVKITGLGTTPTEFQGVLPITHNLVIKDAEYRFVLTAAQARGFVQVAAERCSFP